MDWKKALSPYRRRDLDNPKERSWDAGRTEHERDYDRILFSAPVRRLADKTQVFPLDENDCVHTRLTHSLEVSNLARSIGIYLAFKTDMFPSDVNPRRNVPAILAATGLAHDLGNPPFGHQGEKSIQYWFSENAHVLNCESLSESMRNDFLLFEGNAQTLRILTKLQIQTDDFGLNITVGTLSALMKYTVGSDKADGDHAKASRKKPGFFQSERAVVEQIWEKTGLGEGKRNPLTFIMEACDDIAYSVIDIEDACRKSLISYADVENYLRGASSRGTTTERVIDNCNARREKFKTLGLSPDERNDLSMQFFRVTAIDEMVKAVTAIFLNEKDSICDDSFEGTLISASEASGFCKSLKMFGRTHAYNDETVRQIELEGHDAIYRIMTALWGAISTRKDPNDLSSARKSPLTRFLYSKISENYRRVFELNKSGLPTRYCELQLLTDMVSGMTDSYALALADEIRHYETR